MTIASLTLQPHVQRAAELVLEKHPGVVFTSGRRDILGQAQAMASNTIRYGMDWLEGTYGVKHPYCVEQLVYWMVDHLDKTASVSAMTEGFSTVLTDYVKDHPTAFAHCQGLAFDIACPRFGSGQIDEDNTKAIVTTIQQLPPGLGLTWVTSRESGLRVIHAQFGLSPTTEV